MAKGKRDFEPKTAVFIDGANFYASTKAFGFMIDYKRLRNWLITEYKTIHRIYWYSIMRETDDQYSSLRPLSDWLGYNGFHVNVKYVQEFVDPNTGRRKFRGGMAVDIACDMLEIADHVSNIVLISGDGNLVRPLTTAMKKGCTATVISTKETETPFVADELRRAADIFLDIADIRQHFEGNQYQNVRSAPPMRVAARA